MTEYSRREFSYCIFSRFNRVIYVEFADSPSGQRKICEVSAVPGDCHNGFRHNLYSPIKAVEVGLRIPHLRPFAYLNGSIHDMSDLLCLWENAVSDKMRR